MRRSATSRRSRRPARSSAPACSRCSRAKATSAAIRPWRRTAAPSSTSSSSISTASRRSARFPACRSPAVASTCRSTACRASTTASVSPSSRRRRASWPITLRAMPMSAARSCLRYFEERDMSRIGKKPVPIPSGVTANVEGQTIKMKGPKGALQLVVPDDVEVKMDKSAIKLDPRNETKRARAMWGTSRTLVGNLVTGVTKGFERRLEITGVGYRAAVQGKNLQISLGYSHDVVFPIPDGIAIATPRPTEVVVTGIDRQKVGQVAAEIRGFRPPEPYKGKGVKYSGEYIFRKEGKKK